MRTCDRIPAFTTDGYAYLWSWISSRGRWSADWRSVVKFRHGWRTPTDPVGHDPVLVRRGSQVLGASVLTSWSRTRRLRGTENLVRNRIRAQTGCIGRRTLPLPRRDSPRSTDARRTSLRSAPRRTLVHPGWNSGRRRTEKGRRSLRPACSTMHRLPVTLSAYKPEVDSCPSLVTVR